MLEVKTSIMQFELKTKIQESLTVLNLLLRKAEQENLVVEISNRSATIGKDGCKDCKYYSEIDINLLFLI